MVLEGRNSRAHLTVLDAKDEDGGNNQGPTPKELVLEGLAGCTAMDVLAILRKMRQDVQSFNVEVKTSLTDEHPRVFKDIHIVYTASGKMEEAKLKRAIELSQDKYCGVSAMLKKNSTVTYEYKIEN